MQYRKTKPPPIVHTHTHSLAQTMRICTETLPKRRRRSRKSKLEKEKNNHQPNKKNPRRRRQIRVSNKLLSRLKFSSKRFFILCVVISSSCFSQYSSAARNLAMCVCMCFAFDRWISCLVKLNEPFVYVVEALYPTLCVHKCEKHRFHY